MVLTWRLSVLYGLLPCTSVIDWFGVTEVESVYCAVRTGYLFRGGECLLRGTDWVLRGGECLLRRTDWVLI